MFIDTHCHVYKNACTDIELYIEQSINEDVKVLIDCAENIETSKEILELSKNYKNIIYPTIGIHPEYVLNISYKDLKEMEMLLNKEKFIAVGEIGLDYYYSKDNKEEQIKLFEEQLSLAEMKKLPVIIHSREATNDTISILKKYKVKGIIHSFSGSEETAKEYIKMGYFLGVNGVVTFKNSKLKEVIKEIGLDNLVLETDSPFLSPEPFRGKVNSSKNIPIIAEFIATVLNEDVEKVRDITTKNALSIFDIKSKKWYNFCVEVIKLNTVLNSLKILFIAAVCLGLKTSGFVYLSTAENENYDKTINYSIIEADQYETYVDLLYDPIEAFTGEITGYGADCEGCSGILACRPRTNVFEKGIYFDDKEYGTIRVVAAPREYPCGTIMRFNIPKLGSEPIIAIVMDRGGVINGSILDLLTESESYSAKYVGRVKNIEIEVLRKGW